MVLSQMIMNLDSPQVRKDLSDRYELHATLMRFVDKGASKPLWRLEWNTRTRYPTLLIQTEAAPDPSAVAELDPTYIVKFGSRRNILYENLSNGDEFNFRLRANPTVTRDGKRHGLYREEEQIAWLSRQLEKSGAKLVFTQTSDSVTERMKRRKGSRPISIHGVTFDGVLRTQNPDRLRSAIQSGIGHAKALGFGLLTLAQ